MADSRRYGLNQPIAIGQILAEAQHRWLRPGEICEILRNHQRFRLTSDPPYKPLGGSLFLFDRKTLRYFRKDGHNWRKKKDGKTVREAHEKLKAGSVDVLHCYYAHGEENENFQRRSYWMLDGQLQHIVLVHYREVNEGSRSGIPRLLNADGGMQNDSGSASTSLVHTSSAQVNSPVLAAHASYASSPSTAHWNGQAPSSEFDDGDSGDDFGVSSLGEPTTAGFGVGTLHPTDTAEKNTVGCTGPVHLPCESRGLNDLIGLKDGPSNPFYMNQVDHSNLISDSVLQTDYGVSREAGLLGGISFGLATSSSTWPEAHSSNKDRTTIRVQRIGHAPVYEKSPELTLDPYNINKHGLDGERGAFSDAQLQLLRRNTHESIEERRKEVNAVTAGFPSDNSMINDLPKIYESTQKQNFYSVNSLKENNIGSLMNVAANDSSLDLLTEDGQAQKNDPKSSVCNGERQEELKKLDSFGRWMNREIGRDCDDSLMTSDSPLYWCSLDSESNKDVSSLSSHMQLDADSLGPSLSKDQLFSITDFSPDWAFSGEESKVLISGTFMKNLKQYPPNMKWSCMFGEVEVPAEVLTTNALRCRAPAHVPGLVPLYITCSNRLACSEVREFEFREKVSGLGLSNAVKIESEEELQLQIRFAKMLFLGVDRMQWIGCSKGKCDKCLLMVNMFSESPENEWHQIGRASQQNPREALIQRLLKDRLFDWLLHKIHEEGKGPNVLDERGQGVIHLAAALGYEWAMRPIVAAGVSPSFRDARGRTGLHWAAYFGREETVVTLVGLGAAPGAVEDPTSKFPEGQTAADLASSRGHKGIAGYLAEADLTSHLSALTLKQSGLDSVSGNPDLAEDSIQTEEQTISPFEGIKEQQLSLRESLAAVRNSAQAAARIQAAFRVHSFIQRQSTQASDDHSEVSNELIALAYWNKSQKVGHFSDSLHAAAVRIQQKFRGWKGRKEFLKIRHRIVKIQAHVRGHQVRKQYKKVVWSVSIVEKAILRWRRKGTGLRGFRVDKAIGHSGPESGKTDEYDFLRAGRKKKEAGVEKALARVQSMVRYPEARDQYMRLVQKAKTREGAAA